MSETVLISIKLLKRYCKATLDNFSNKKKFDDDKKILTDRFFESKQVLLLNIC